MSGYLFSNYQAIAISASIFSPSPTAFFVSIIGMDTKKAVGLGEKMEAEMAMA
jgi:hypothetical protein